MIYVYYMIYVYMYIINGFVDLYMVSSLINIFASKYSRHSVSYQFWFPRELKSEKYCEAFQRP